MHLKVHRGPYPGLWECTLGSVSRILGVLGGIMGFRDSLRGRCLGFWGCSVGLVPSALRMHLEVSTQGFEGGILGPCFGDSPPG